MTVALRALLVRVGRAIGIEGAFLAIGTALLAVGASYLHPAGPWLVTGLVAVLLGLATAITPRPAPREPSAKEISDMLGYPTPPEVR